MSRSACRAAGQPNTEKGSRPDENQVSSTSVSCSMCVAAAVAHDSGRLARHRDFAAGCAMPRRNAMTPPELARDAPVVDVAHPLEVGLRVLLRRKVDVALFDRGNCLVGQRLNLDEPLRRKPRLNHRLAAVALADGVHVVLHCQPADPVLPDPPALSCALRSDPAPRMCRPQRCSCALSRPSR